MKISKLKNIAWVFFALTLTSITVLAQGRRSENGFYQNQRNYCLNSISGLSETQQEQIQQLENEHQQAMAELRNERRSTINAVEKSEIRTKMLKKVEAHRHEVKNLLTADQQEQYKQLHANGSYGQNQNEGRGYRNATFNRQCCGSGNAGFGRQGNGGRNRVYASGQNQGSGNRGWNQGKRRNCVRLNRN